METRFVAGFAACAALVTTLPVVGARSVPSIVRAALAIALAPLAAAHVHAAVNNPASHVAIEACVAALGGATMGLCAAIVAGAAASAGALLDVAIAASPAGADRASGSSGPFAMLLTLGFGVVLLSSGGLTWLLSSFVALFDTANGHAHAAALVVALGRVAYDAAIAAALPLLGACGVSSLVAAAAARAAPRINGMLLAPALSSPLALAVALAAVPGLFVLLHRLAGLTVRLAQAA